MIPLLNIYQYSSEAPVGRLCENLSRAEAGVLRAVRNDSENLLKSSRVFTIAAATLLDKLLQEAKDAITAPIQSYHHIKHSFEVHKKIQAIFNEIHNVEGILSRTDKRELKLQKLFLYAKKLQLKLSEAYFRIPDLPLSRISEVLYDMRSLQKKLKVAVEQKNVEEVEQNKQAFMDLKTRVASIIAHKKTHPPEVLHHSAREVPDNASIKKLKEVLKKHITIFTEKLPCLTTLQNSSSEDSLEKPFLEQKKSFFMGIQAFLQNVDAITDECLKHLTTIINTHPRSSEDYMVLKSMKEELRIPMEALKACLEEFLRRTKNTDEERSVKKNYGKIVTAMGIFLGRWERISLQISFLQEEIPLDYFRQKNETILRLEEQGSLALNQENCLPEEARALLEEISNVAVEL